ncbi:RNA 2'-phosphotransferase [Hymenobacter cavernae]|uniref:Probable RNA 2'-phosphotransferase n=1 Tax=Hymenobacter cavernae TaxID=2044852 RepID=A0ABQ1U1F8_9BACT|nr:RNA 2'-phosphotransferase [Hymenobacter cavernae]GGF08123.1 putative RNA 2'-phosphotransferase [Hymenobacter cavernae]
MNKNDNVKISKFLSKYLRHDPQAIGLELQEGGWVAVDDLLVACARHNLMLTHLELAEIVESSDKKRFAFDATGTLIRAQQGHSVPVDLQLTPLAPPAVLYHGTVAAALPDIWREGLQKMSRHHVHLSPDVETAQRVGGRRGKPVVLVVDAAALHKAGAVFYESGNGVWLVDQVPPGYLKELAA